MSHLQGNNYHARASSAQGSAPQSRPIRRAVCQPAVTIFQNSLLALPQVICNSKKVCLRRMDFGAKPSGSDPKDTQNTILQNELAKLTETRYRMKEENAAYLQQHPELRSMLDEFMVSALAEKPADLIKYAAVYFTKLRDPTAVSGLMPLVITGCNGNGKTSVCNKLIELFPQYFEYPIKHTSRVPRQGEENGVHFHFVQKSDIESAINRREFIEYSAFQNSLYGTSVNSIDDVRRAGKICLLDLDYKSVQMVKDSMLVVKFVFLTPPSIEQLSIRLKELNQETTTKISGRIQTAAGELDAVRSDAHIDKVIINDNIDQCVNRLIYCLDGWYPELNFHENDVDEEDIH